ADRHPHRRGRRHSAGQRIDLTLLNEAVLGRLAHQHADQARHAADRLGFLRDGMRLRGVPLPELPPGLIHLDDTPA
ncbi:hypothetical protein AB0K48_32950, partial [Nonomuraea sp. NPDC055795]